MLHAVTGRHRHTTIAGLGALGFGCLGFGCLGFGCFGLRRLGTLGAVVAIAAADEHQFAQFEFTHDCYL